MTETNENTKWGWQSDKFLITLSKIKANVTFETTNRLYEDVKIGTVDPNFLRIELLDGSEVWLNRSHIIQFSSLELY